MVISLALLFTVCMASSFFEERFRTIDKVILYVILGIAMVFIAGLRGVGNTPDTLEYEEMYYVSNAITQALTEPSFLLISDILKSLDFFIRVSFLILLSTSARL